MDILQSLTADWRKQASMTAANDKDIEKVFADTSSGFVENKVGDLMKDKHRIGFEIVKKNDDNTRMVGIYAFRVESELIFAPVFFLNGEIKGPLLFRCNAKQFIPANKEWTAYLIESIERSDGESRPIHMRKDDMPLVQMQRLTFRPDTGGIKSASENTIEVAATLVDKTSDKQEEVLVKVAAQDDGRIRFCYNNISKDMSMNEGLDFIEAFANKECPDQFVTSAWDGIWGETENTFDLKFDKSASEKIASTFLTDVENNVEEWAATALEAVEKCASVDSNLIKDFCSDPTYGEAARDLIIKAGNTDTDSGYDFANMVAYLYPNAECFEADLEKKAAEKQSPKTGLALMFSEQDIVKENDYKRVPLHYYQDGFFLMDKRDHTADVYTQPNTKLESPSIFPGYYDLLGKGGEIIKDVLVTEAFYGRIETEDIPTISGGRCLSGCDYHQENTAYRCFKDDKVAIQSQVFGQLSEKKVKLEDTMSEGSTYYAIVNGVSAGPIHVVSKKTVGNTDIYQVHTNRWQRDTQETGDVKLWTDNDTSELIHNKSLTNSTIEEYVFGADTKFFKIDTKKAEKNWVTDDYPKGRPDRYISISGLKDIGNERAISAWIENNDSLLGGTISKEASSEFYSLNLANGERAQYLTRKEALIKLAANLSIAAPVAYAMLAEAETNGKHSFLVEMEKEASRYQLLDRPVFEEDYDEVQGTRKIYDQTFHLRMGAPQAFEPPARVGDQLNPTTATGLPNLTVTSTSPEDLRSVADTFKLPNVFEHGVIGTLADTFDAITMMDKYIPKMQDCVDALGRSMFLLYWCPNDFEKAYGKDDMTNLEAEISSNLDALGTLLLKLLKKADKTKRNNSPFKNN